MSVQQICNELSPGTAPTPVFGTPQLSCLNASSYAKQGLVPGLFVGGGQPISQLMASRHPASYSTDPANPWADWIIPDGAPLPPPPNPSYTWYEYPGQPRFCPPDCPQ